MTYCDQQLCTNVCHILWSVCLPTCLLLYIIYWQYKQSDRFSHIKVVALFYTNCHINGNITVSALEFKYLLSYIIETKEKAMYVFGPITLTTKQALYGPLSITMANLKPLSNLNSCCLVFMQLRDTLDGDILRTISITSQIASATSEF